MSDAQSRGHIVGHRRRVKVAVVAGASALLVAAALTAATVGPAGARAPAAGLARRERAGQPRVSPRCCTR